MRVISWGVQEPLASREELCSMELSQAVGWTVFGNKAFCLLVETVHICCYYSSSLQVNIETGHDHIQCVKHIQLHWHKKTSKVGHEPFQCIQCEVLSLITPSRLQSYGLVPVADRSTAPPAGKKTTGVLDVGQVPTWKFGPKYYSFLRCAMAKLTWRRGN